MLNVKQGSCEYQLLKSFGSTQLGNRTLVYRLRGFITSTNDVQGPRQKNFVGGGQRKKDRKLALLSLYLLYLYQHV